MKTKYFMTIGFLFLVGIETIRGVSGETDHSISLNISYVQVKDQFNYGLSFGGLSLAGIYEMRSETGKLDLSYGAGFGLGVVQKKGLGILLRLKPLDGFAGFRLTNGHAHKIVLGPYLSAYYMWQLYPELQSGHLFWFSSYELGPRLTTNVPLNKYELRISASMALAAFNSRPEYETEQYYYSSTFSDFFRNPHTNMKAGFPGTFNHIEFALELNPPTRNMTFGYRFEYIGYRDAPSFQYMTHTLLLSWSIGSQKH